MGHCGGAGRQSPKTLHSSFTQFCDYFQATTPSECHMKNIFSLSNYPFKCEAQRSKAHGEFLVNMLIAMWNHFFFLWEKKTVTEQDLESGTNWKPHLKNIKMVIRNAFEFPFQNKT